MEFLLTDEKKHQSYVLARAVRRSATLPREIPVLARALLLLRLASAAGNELLRSSTISADDLRFWWETYGSDSGFWSDPAELETLADLWMDVSDAIADTEESTIAGTIGQSVREIQMLVSLILRSRSITGHRCGC